MKNKRVAWNKGKHLSAEHKRKLSESHKGKPSSRRGQKLPDWWKKKLRESHKGQTPWNKGKPFSEEVRKKMSIARMGKKPSYSFPKGHIPWNKGNRAENGDRVSRWKGGRAKDKKWRAYWEEKRRIRKNGNGGSFTFGEWEKLKAQYNWTCPACGRKEPEIQLTIDHIVPISKGGSDNIENIQPLCRSCNAKKHTKIIKY